MFHKNILFLLCPNVTHHLFLGAGTSAVTMMPSVRHCIMLYPFESLATHQFHNKSIRVMGTSQRYGSEEVKFWKQKHFEERSWKRTRKHLTFWGAGNESIFHKTRGRNEEAEAVKFLRKRKHFEERSWKQTWKQLTLCGAGSGSKKIFYCFHIPGTSNSTLSTTNSI